MEMRASLIGLDRGALKAALLNAGVPEKSAAMRVSQLWNWIYVHGAREFSAMTNLARDFRELLEQSFTLARPEIVTAQVSEDGTRKWLLRTGPGIEFETVYIPEADRGTLCVSSQVGCTLTCRFCHTGTQKLVRNLNPDEILGQVHDGSLEGRLSVMIGGVFGHVARELGDLHVGRQVLLKAGVNHLSLGGLEAVRDVWDRSLDVLGAKVGQVPVNKVSHGQSLDLTVRDPMWRLGHMVRQPHLPIIR